MNHPIYIWTGPNNPKDLVFPENCNFVVRTPFLPWVATAPLGALPPAPAGLSVPRRLRSRPRRQPAAALLHSSTAASRARRPRGGIAARKPSNRAVAAELYLVMRALCSCVRLCASYPRCLWLVRVICDGRTVLSTVVRDEIETVGASDVMRQRVKSQVNKAVALKSTRQ